MRIQLSIFGCFFAALYCGAQNNNLFYYGFADPVYLSVVPGKYTVEFNEPGGQAYLQSSGLPSIQLSPKVFEVTAALNAVTAATSGHFTYNPVYAASDDTKLYMLNQIVLRWKNGVSESAKNSIRTQYGLTLLRSTRLYDLYRSNSPLSVSKLIYESGQVTYSQPEFIAPVVKHDYIPSDEFFSQQFYLHNTGQQCNDGHFGTVDGDIDAPAAWDITFGNSGVVVAVVDEGVTSNHPDLPNTRQLRLPGSNFAASFDGSDPDDPSPNASTNENHGNACAGIVGAEIDNNEGIVGIAPDCTVMPVKVRFGIGLTWTNFADAVTFAADNGADVVTCSWGAGSGTFDASIITAIEDAIDQGSVVFFSAGNSANHEGGIAGSVGFPGNANIPLLLTIGASDRNDVQADYSPTDTELDLTAPSHTAYSCHVSTEGFNIWTMDIPGLPGYNPHHDLPGPCDDPPNGNLTEELPASGTNYLDYTGRMGGTSAATPEVAAIAALMLSVNPCLSVAQIHDMLIGTAEQVGGYDYAWNASDLGHSKELGHGRANAYLAVSAAQGAYSAST